MKKILPLLLVLFAVINLSNAQTFTNGELDGSSNCYSCAPAGWLLVPFTDPVCIASSSFQASSDILNTAGPNVFLGINGNPFSGTSMVSGVLGWDGASTTYHEGIMQTVNGFTIGQIYSISFYQAVVKQDRVFDQSGSWSLYLDTVLIATTAPSTSTLPFNSNSLTWDLRTVNFTATAVTHTIKFLPEDDDPNILISASDITGALRMGLDLVSFNTILPVVLQNYEINCYNSLPEIKWSTSAEINNDYFTIEKSIDAVNWEIVTYIQGAGNSNQQINYSYIDDSYENNNQTTYYRLKQTDFNGKYEYFNVLPIKCEGALGSSPIIFPNPATSTLTISGKEINKIEIIDLLGRIVKQINSNLNAINISNLSNGTYVIKIYETDKISNHHFIKQ